MRVVVDTNVLAYALLDVPGHVEEAVALLDSATDLLAPSVWEAELANVIWMAVRAGVIDAGVAPAKLGIAARLGVQSVDMRTLWQGALLRSIQSGVAVYDSLFVELAEREKVLMASFDQKLARVFPELVLRPSEIR